MHQHGAEVVIQALKASEYQSVRSKTYVANGSQRIFSCGFTPPDEHSILVSKNGDLLQDKDYVVQGNKVIFRQMRLQDKRLKFVVSMISLIHLVIHKHLTHSLLKEQEQSQMDL